MLCAKGTIALKIFKVLKALKVLKVFKVPKVLITIKKNK